MQTKKTFLLGIIFISACTPKLKDIAFDQSQQSQGGTDGGSDSQQGASNTGVDVFLLNNNLGTPGANGYLTKYNAATGQMQAVTLDSNLKLGNLSDNWANNPDRVNKYDIQHSGDHVAYFAQSINAQNLNVMELMMVDSDTDEVKHLGVILSRVGSTNDSAVSGNAILLTQAGGTNYIYPGFGDGGIGVTKTVNEYFNLDGSNINLDTGSGFFSLGKGFFAVNNSGSDSASQVVILNSYAGTYTTINTLFTRTIKRVLAYNSTHAYFLVNNTSGHHSIYSLRYSDGLTTLVYDSYNINEVVLYQTPMDSQERFYFFTKDESQNTMKLNRYELTTNQITEIFTQTLASGYQFDSNTSSYVFTPNGSLMDCQFTVSYDVDAAQMKILGFSNNDSDFIFGCHQERNNQLGYDYIYHVDVANHQLTANQFTAAGIGSEIQLFKTSQELVFATSIYNGNSNLQTFEKLTVQNGVITKSVNGLNYLNQLTNSICAKLSLTSQCGTLSNSYVSIEQLNAKSLMIIQSEFTASSTYMVMGLGTIENPQLLVLTQQQLQDPGIYTSLMTTYSKAISEVSSGPIAFEMK